MSSLFASSSSSSRKSRATANEEHAQWLQGVISRDSLIVSSPSSSPTFSFARPSSTLFPLATADPTSPLSTRSSSSMSSRGPATPYQTQQRQAASSSPSHPYSSSAKSSPTMVRDTSAEQADCPVCLESLSMRLQGEKPHVVPVCGHKLRVFACSIPHDIPHDAHR